MTKKNVVIRTDNDENDDWMQKSNPETYVVERRIHANLAKKKKKKKETAK